MTKFFIRYIYTEKERVGITKILNDIKNMNNAGINNNVSTIKGENILKKKKKNYKTNVIQIYNLKKSVFEIKRGVYSVVLLGKSRVVELARKLAAVSPVNPMPCLKSYENS